MSRILIVGAGMTQFSRPQPAADSPGFDYDQLAAAAAAEALQDAGISYTDVSAVVASYCYGDPAAGQRAVYRLGLTGAPVYNVNNNCSSGSSAIALARSLLLSGTLGTNCGPVLVLGFEQMERGGLSRGYPERPDPVGRHCDRVSQLGGSRDLCTSGMSQWTSDVIRMFAGAAAEYRDAANQPAMMSEQLLASVAYKARTHGSQNPRAMLSRVKPQSPDQLLKAPMLCPPIRVSFCAPVATGAACVVMATAAWWSGRRLPVTELVDQEIVSDFSDTFEHGSNVKGGGFSSLCGLTQARVASSRIYHRQRLDPRTQLRIVELHDCFASNELMLYEALDLADTGRGPEYFKAGRWAPTSGEGAVFVTGRQQVINPSGGLMSKGHPIGASGVAQCAEIVWQHRGVANGRQVPLVDEDMWALQHNFGLGSSCSVALYRRLGGSAAAAAKL